MQHHRITPEFQSVLRFLQSHSDVDQWDAHVPQRVSGVQKRASSDVAASFLADGGTPVCITDAFQGSEAMNTWSFEWMSRACGDCMIRANDRAPARHADAHPGNGGMQHTVQLRLREYIQQHVLSAPAAVSGYGVQPPQSTPLYLNGWRAFVDCPKLCQDFPPPAFVTGIDQTVELLKALDAQLFGSKPGPQEVEVASWCTNVDNNLTKLFLGPPGTVTRLHFDAGEAHGWLVRT
jgi:hypothetical protein